MKAESLHLWSAEQHTILGENVRRGVDGQINLCDRGINLSPIKTCAHNKILHKHSLVLKKNASSNQCCGTALTTMINW